MNLGSVGAWSGLLRRGERQAAVKAAAELDELGYSALWFPGGQHEDVVEHIWALLRGTRKAVIATGIVSVWTHPAQTMAEAHHALTQAHPDRFLLGIGISHQHAVEGAGIKYEKPLQKLRSYLDELDAAPHPVPVDERIIASLGPLSLKLSRDRTLGTHPYFMPVAHTRIAREAVGSGKVVAPEQMVVVETDPSRARGIARKAMDRYLHAPNYVNNLLRLGYTDADVGNGGSDRLVDDLIAWGSPDKITERIREHHQAGADHVCIQVLTEDPADLSAVMRGYRALAPAVVA
jgi:probable F420-dependent oxidoreductase